MEKTSRAILLLIPFLLAGCNGDDSGGQSTAPTPVTTTTVGPCCAVIELEVVDFGLGGAQGGGAFFGLELRLQESGGVGANINFIRLDVIRADGGLEERAEFGAADIISAVGTNRLDANGTWQEVVVFFFRATIKTGRELIVTVDLTDDQGNAFPLTEAFIFG